MKKDKILLNKFKFKLYDSFGNLFMKPSGAAQRH